MNTAFVLGLFDTGLAAVRSLARHGVPVRGFDSEHRQYGFRSRYGVHQLCPDAIREPDALVRCLLDQARRLSTPPVLYPTSDAFVAFVSEHRDELEKHCMHALPSPDAVALALDKRGQYERALQAGVPVVPAHWPADIEAVRALAPTLTYPVVVKPAVGHLWRARSGRHKAFFVSDADSLNAVSERLFMYGQTAVIQSFVAGPNTNHSKVCAYFDAAGRPQICVCMRKIRQHPVDFGVGTMMESVHDPEVASLGLRLFGALGWRGPGSIEFKCDERDGKWKLIELNPRLWQQHGLAATCGADFSVIQYHDLTGSPPPAHRYRVGIRWVDEFRDPRSSWEHWRHGQLTLRQWIRSWRGVRGFALFACDDPVPFFASLRDLCITAVTRTLRMAIHRSFLYGIAGAAYA
jgi:predicted ATP-grasp superfamily ATP-dependent carboligase